MAGLSEEERIRRGKPPRRTYSWTTKKEALARVAAGEAPEAVASALAMPEGTLKHWMSGRYASEASGRRTGSPPRRDVIDGLSSGETIEELARRLDVDVGAVRRVVVTSRAFRFGRGVEFEASPGATRGELRAAWISLLADPFVTATKLRLLLDAFEAGATMVDAARAAGVDRRDASRVHRRAADDGILEDAFLRQRPSLPRTAPGPSEVPPADAPSRDGAWASLAEGGRVVFRGFLSATCMRRITAVAGLVRTLLRSSMSGTEDVVLEMRRHGEGSVFEEAEAAILSVLAPNTFRRPIDVVFADGSVRLVSKPRRDRC